MLYVVVHLTIVPGQEAAFRQYETAALQCWLHHGGQLVCAFKPQPQASPTPTPDEIHVLQIASREAFENFRNAPELKALADLRAAAVQSTRVYIAQEMLSYEPETVDE